MLKSSGGPSSLLLVRSTLEVAALLKSVRPALTHEVEELECEVTRAGQLLLDAGSVARARLALERIHQVRLTLEALRVKQEERQRVA
ncbi:MAG: hypothetical protein KY445_13995 [Armatimonadetes bacterium]|nr:hypothetical protein [Armatimonadota bacterium]